ncbi:uncharacterized protein LOC114543640 [Dendronephthya gigantea]|uniref:uncharacterized protein LOC114543640 n=1 Tax=Dendronephthya gigantea TaxID=151771 RepID=UPI00106C4EE6|nr:uncharacterized protein LOC114543640 [Dendronephthya gigantea]
MRNSCLSLIWLLQFWFILWFFMLALTQCQTGLRDCSLKGDCKFVCPNIPGYSDDVEIDLSSLDSPNGPRFKHISDSQGGDYTYSWNPCTKYSSNGCKNVHACQFTDTTHYSLGSLLLVFYSTESGLCIMRYLNGDGGRELKVTLRYEANEEGRVPGIKEDHQQYTMTLYTKYAPHHGGSDDSGGGISIGTILCIIFFTVLVLYLGIGITYKYRRGAQGKDRIPNYEFWAKMVGLIKDGCIFSAKKTKGCISNAMNKTGRNKEQNDSAGYEEIKNES